MRLMSRMAIAALALLLLGAAPATAAGSGASVPIHGVVLTEGPPPDVTAPGCEPAANLMWRFSREGTGNLSHLGKVTLALSHCTYLVTPVPLHAEFLGGTITVTAANRDTLELAYVGTTDALVDPVTMEFTGYTAEGTWTAVGGTGRFAHATGSGWFDVVGDVPGGDALFGLPDGADRWAFGGAIAYDASDRSR